MHPWMKGSWQCRWELGQGGGPRQGQGLGGRTQQMRAMDEAGEAGRGWNLI